MIGFSESERLAFKPMLVTEEGFTDELLQQHKKEAENLTSRYETMKPILEVRERSTVPVRVSCRRFVDSKRTLFIIVSRCPPPHVTTVTLDTCPELNHCRKSKSASLLSSDGSSTRPARKTPIVSGPRAANRNGESNSGGEIDP